jgi:hypothetical protein
MHVGREGSPDVLVAHIDPLPRDGDGVPPNYIPGTQFRLHSFPTLAVDRSNRVTRGNVYVAWADESGGENATPDILFARSTDGGAFWCDPVRVSDDTNGEYQWFPWMTVDSDGNIDIVFYDRRLTPGTAKFDLYRARSTDGGLTFSPNVRVSAATSDIVNDGFTGSDFIGDYNGMTVAGGAVRPVWTDLSGPNAEGFIESITTAGPPCPGQGATVVAASMQGWAGSGPYPGTMTLHFSFGTTEVADQFKVRYRKTHPPPASGWVEVTCAQPSTSCQWNCDGSVELTATYAACDPLTFQWEAMGQNCQGWQCSGWPCGPTKTFTTQCLEEP